MKKTFIILGLIIVAIIIWMATKPKPDATVPEAVVSDSSTTIETTTTKSEDTKQATGAKQVDNANVKVSFKGFGPDKVHNGTFGKVTSKLDFVGTDLAGEVVVDMTSLVADDTEKLTPHLKSDAFFDVAKYPTATFKLFSVAGGKAVGKLTTHGVTKDVSFPIVKTDMEYKASFNIDMKAFGIVQAFANEVVEVTVTVPLK